MIKNFKSWIKSAAIRAIRTFAQSFLASIPMGAAFLGSVNWGMVLSSAALAAVLSIMTSLKGLPEVENVETTEKGTDVETSKEDE